MKRLKTWLIRLLGGHVEPIEVEKTVEKKLYVVQQKISYEGLGRPLDVEDWNKLASMYSWGEVFFRFIAFELQAIDEEERRLPHGPEKDRDRLVLAIRRGSLKDLQRVPETFAAKMVAEYQQTEVRAKERGLSNHGK
jgi:hypothetical protein